MTAVLSFLVGILLAFTFFYVFYSKKIHALKEELITVNAKSKSTEELQEIIKMSYYQDLNQREISEKIHISQMQVSRRLKKALNKMYEIIKSKDEN